MDLTEDEKHYLETGEDKTAQADEAPAQETTEAKSEPSGDQYVAADEAAPEAPKEEPKTPLQKMVDKKALDAERAQHKKTKAELQRIEMESREKAARLEERLNILQAALQPEPAAAPARPDPDEDIFGAYKDLEGRFNNFMQQNEAQRKQQEQYQRVVAINNQVETAYRQDAAQFAGQNPDFTEAYKWLIKSRQAEYAQIPGYRENPGAAAKALHDEEMNIARNALQGRSSPAETMYNIALARGWKGNVGSAPVERQNTASDQVKRLSKAQDASASLTKVGGSTGGSTITLDTLDRMSKKEFQDFIASKNKNNPNGYDQWFEKQMLDPKG